MEKEDRAEAETTELWMEHRPHINYAAFIRSNPDYAAKLTPETIALFEAREARYRRWEELYNEPEA